MKAGVEQVVGGVATSAQQIGYDTYEMSMGSANMTVVCKEQAVLNSACAMGVLSVPVCEHA